MSNSEKMLPMEEWSFDDAGNPVRGADRKGGIKPYVRFDLCEIWGIPSSGLATWILLLRQWKSTGKEWVTIPCWIRDEAGVSQRKIARGLQVLETAGFVELQKRTGRSTLVYRKQKSDIHEQTREVVTKH